MESGREEPEFERQPAQKQAPGPLPRPTRPKVIFSEPDSGLTEKQPDSSDPVRSEPVSSESARKEKTGALASSAQPPLPRPNSDLDRVQPRKVEASISKDSNAPAQPRTKTSTTGLASTGTNSSRSERRSVELKSRRQESHGLNGLYFLLASAALMFGMWFIGPRLVEEYHYAAERGKTRAIYENAVTQLDEAPLANVSQAYQLVAQRIRPSVVSVNAIKSTRDGNGLGSGVIMSANGYILTHVLEDASRYLIELSDRRRFEASLVGTDSTSDLAVLKINAPNLIPATWGNSDEVDVGSIVWAIGSPYGFQQTVTSGIISGKDRPGDPQHQKQSLLQTDAAVNPGNSGGPLVDAQGRVIGINTSIFGKTFQGISFAVPSETAKFVYQQLLTNGKVTRGYLGAMPAEVDFDDVLQMQLPDLDGAKLSDIRTGSPAYNAGIRRGDIIRSWDGIEIKEFKDLYRVAEKAEPNSRVLVTLIRDGQERSTEVVVGTLPDFDSEGGIRLEKVRGLYGREP